jgi:hypothetical protein
MGLRRIGTPERRLRELGWVEGPNLTVDYRDHEGHDELDEATLPGSFPLAWI